MKKTILTLAIAMLSLGGFNAMAQTNNNGNTEQCAPENCKDKANCPKKDKKGKKDGKKCDKKGPRKGGGEACCKGGKDGGMLKGITLTNEQQQKVDKIRENAKKDMAKIKEEGQKDREKLMKKSQEEISKVLTAEQRVQFEANQKAFEAKKAAKADVKRMKNEYIDAKKVLKRDARAQDTKIKREFVRGEKSIKNGEVKLEKAAKNVNLETSK